MKPIAFVKLQPEMVRDLGLSLRGAIVLATMQWQATELGNGEEGEVVISHKELAAIWGQTRAWSRKGIEELEARGLVAQMKFGESHSAGTYLISMTGDEIDLSIDVDRLEQITKELDGTPEEESKVPDGTQDEDTWVPDGTQLGTKRPPIGYQTVPNRVPNGTQLEQETRETRESGDSAQQNPAELFDTGKRPAPGEFWLDEKNERLILHHCTISDITRDWWEHLGPKIKNTIVNGLPGELTKDLTLWNKTFWSHYWVCKGEWERTYLGVFVHEDELRRAHAWLVANPKRRKKDQVRFFTNWLAHAKPDNRIIEEKRRMIEAMDREMPCEAAS